MAVGGEECWCALEKDPMDETPAKVPKKEKGKAEGSR